MSSVDLLYPAIIIFTLMVIGLVMTVMEFKKNSGAEPDSEHRDKGK